LNSLLVKVRSFLEATSLARLHSTNGAQTLSSFLQQPIEGENSLSLAQYRGQTVRKMSDQEED
jgi:hypothetical protein